MNTPSNLALALAKGGKTKPRPKPAPVPQPKPLPQPEVKKPRRPQTPLPGYDTRIGLDAPTIWQGKPKKAGSALALALGGKRR